jgi:hypothetical protein
MNLLFQRQGSKVIDVCDDGLYNAMLKHPAVYLMAGVEACTCFDVALNCGGTEAVVESYYSVMGTQRQDGGQNNETLALRTKLDWLLPNITQVSAIADESDIYHWGKVI